MPPGDCEILRPFCCPADGAAMGAAAPGRDMGKESKEGAAGRGRAGRRGQGFGTPCVRGLRHSLHARPPRPCRDIRAFRESLSPLSLRESLSPCALPSPCLRGVCPFRLLGSMPGRGCSHGCAWLAYLRSFRFLLANTRFTAICDNF